MELVFVSREIVTLQVSSQERPATVLALTRGELSLVVELPR
jgi:hypothetical protein